jgi:hypothetical protein
MDPRATIQAFDDFLAQERLELEAVVIGGTALNLLGVVTRPTRDCDVLHPSLPPSVAAAAQRFAAQVRNQGGVLQEDWLNNGPASLANQLPEGWQQRLQPLFTGKALRLSSLGRDDLLRSKLFALCDRGIDLGDCIALQPNQDELQSLLPWLEWQDANPEWPAHVRATMADLGRRLGHGV